jgi:hypothetical protein
VIPIEIPKKYNIEAPYCTCCTIKPELKGIVSRDFLLQVFFMNHLPPSPGGKLPPVSTTPAANFATSSPCVVDTGGKFATGVNDTGGKFAADVNDAGGKIIGKTSGCRHLKVNLKAKIYIYVSSTTQR